MYKNTNSTTTFDLMNYIEGDDVYNSQLVYDIDTKLINNPSNIEGEYNNIFNKGRLDLVTTELYSETDVTNEGILQVLNRLLIQDDTEMTGIKYVSQNTVNKLSLYNL